ncbi:N-acetyl-gamma-glutamyl-phosphate reductase [Alkalibacterium sp. AK22]|uniref:N-acetyl-gamma-glutamyl-phosphate reductase n=1 Tax=Alkalibacterium sp. AK22 TaxID=1229520 RepID=UPI000445A4B9|nr:N-acetyl-gamma-glutamyl-phosphate reductase [Alkalibacterium sp. AK22]EXJ23715.1 N-acetyl-gamma-glutamyl-phosphate reductase [Alkalibacterium sp. AK22]
MSMIQAGVIGASGYVGSELIKILLGHSHVDIAGVSSDTYAGQSFSSVYPTFKGQFDGVFEQAEQVIAKADIIFICLPHGMSEDLVKQCLDLGKKVIDAGADFRLQDLTVYEDWYKTAVRYPELHEQAVYGLTELNREKIQETDLVANPGCYPTSILLALYPAVANGLIKTDSLIIDAKSGVTGAGKSLSEATHFATKNEGFAAYKIGSHRHIPEIEEQLAVMGGQKSSIAFVPHLLPVNRGILATVYADLQTDAQATDIQTIYEDWYEDAPFVQVKGPGQWPDISHVQHSNQCHIGLTVDERTSRLILVSVIDNMQKGAAGQAVQNLNVMYGLTETEGLAMVAPSF